MEDAVQIALRNNPDLLQARRQIDAAEARVLQAGRIAHPEINVQWNDAPSFTKLGEADETEIGITQELEFPSKRSFRVDISEHEKTQALLRFSRMQVIITTRVKQAYYAAVFMQRSVQSLEEQSRLLQDFVQLTTDRLTSGAGKYLDVVRAKVELSRLGNDIVEARRGLQEKRRTLNLLLGRDIDLPLLLVDSLDHGTVHIDRDSLAARLAAGSAFLKLARVEVERQKSVLSLARTALLPDFSVGLSFQRSGEQPPFNANAFMGTTTSGVGLSLSATIPLWFWKEPRGQVDEAIALASVAGMRLESAERRVHESIRSALGLVDATEAQLNVFGQSLLDDINDALAAVITQYQNAQLDALDLLDVYRTYRAARLEYDRAQFNHASARADLEAAAEVPLFENNE